MASLVPRPCGLGMRLKHGMHAVQLMLNFMFVLLVSQPRGSVQPCGSITFQSGSCMSIGLQ